MPRKTRRLISPDGRAGTSLRRIFAVAGFVAASLLGACVAYEPIPAGYSRPASLDRSFNAAVGAMQEQGVAVTQEVRGAGAAPGTRGPIDVTAQVRPQIDGSVRVQFDTRGATASDPTLIDRITRSDTLE